LLFGVNLHNASSKQTIDIRPFVTPEDP